MNLLLIRKDTPQIKFIIDNLDNNTQYIIINPYENSEKLIDKIKNKCQNNIIENIGFMTLNDYKEEFYLCKFEKCILNNCENYDPELITWQPIISLLNYLKNNHNCQTFDMLTCNIYNNDNWNFIIENIYNKTNIHIRSSINITGINGDWILESHNINLIGLYFNDNIVKYSHDLDLNYNLNFIISENQIKIAGNDSNGLVGFQNNLFKNCDISNNLTIKDFAIGENYTVILTNNNKLYSLGINDIGQLGDGTYINKYSLVEMDLININNRIIDKIYSSQYSTHIVTQDNKIFSCGANYNGQLGIGNDEEKNILTQTDTSILNNNQIIKFSTGVGFFFVLTSNNQIYACGSNNMGQLGIMNNISANKLTQVSLHNFYSNTYPIDVNCGGFFSVVLSNDYNIYCCGFNNFGQLGIGNTDNKNTLIRVNITNFIPKQISCGYLYTCILSNNNELYFCGHNQYGQFGNDATNNTNTFTKTTLPNISPAKITCGNYHTIIQTTNNLIYSTGNNEYGQLGIGKNTTTKVFTLVDSVSLDISSSTVIKAGYDNSFILSNKLYSCGNNMYYNLINNDNLCFSNTKIFTNLNDKIKNIKYGKNFIVILTENNNIFTCGVNTYGQLGIGTTINSNILNNLNEVSIAISPSVYPIDIACGDEHFIVLMNNNKVYGCGRNNYGQLCQNENVNFKSLTLINTTEKIIKIACGAYHSVFLTDNFNVLSCGLNNYGQLGIENNTNSNLLIQTNLTILNGNKPKYIACGSHHTVILTDNYNLFSCGLNNYGQLGNENNTNSNSLIQTNLTTLNDNKPIYVSCGSYHTTILTQSGKVYSCGLNIDGQLCNKSYINSNKLLEIDYNNIVNDNNKIISIYSNNSNTFLLDESNNIYACGKNNNLQLGLGITSNYFSNSSLINTSIDPSNIYLGAYNTYIFTDNNLLYGSGRNVFNQLNNNNFQYTYYIENLIEFNLNNFNNISYITAGNENIFIVNNDELFVCGKNNIGQLGNNNYNSSEQLEKVNIFEFSNNIPKKVFTFDEHTFVLTVNNKLFASGNNMYGQLGDNSNISVIKFKLIDTTFLDSSIIANIVCGKNHSVILTNDGKIFASGSNFYGQLGNGSNNNTNSFIRINTDFFNGTPIQIASGAYHTLILTSTYKIYGCGLNVYGQLGNNSLINSNIFVEMNIGVTMPREIYCGYDWSLILTNTNELYGCGRNSEGQIELTTEKIIVLPRKINTVFNNGEYITKVACGFYHFIILSNLNNLYSFGNNDFGQSATNKINSVNQLFNCKPSRNFYNLSANFLNSVFDTQKNLIYVIFNIFKLITKYNLSLRQILTIVNIKELELLGYSLQKLKDDGITIENFIREGFTIREIYNAGFTIQELITSGHYSFFDLLENFSESELGNYKLMPYSQDKIVIEPNDYYIFIKNNLLIKNNIFVNRIINGQNTNNLTKIPFLTMKMNNIPSDNFKVIKTSPINIKINDFNNFFYADYRFYNAGLILVNNIIEKYLLSKLLIEFANEYENKYNLLFNNLNSETQISFFKELNDITNIKSYKIINKLNNYQFDLILNAYPKLDNKSYITLELISYSQTIDIGLKLNIDFILYA